MSVVVKIRVDDKGNAKIIDLGKNAKEAEAKVKPLGTTLQKVFSASAFLYGLDKLKDGIFSMSQELLKFEYNMKKVEAVGGISGGALKSVEKNFRDLATTTEFSASKISAAGLEIIKTGFDNAAEVAEAMPHILNLATAATMDLDNAAMSAISTLKAFGLENNELGRVANVMTTGLNATALGAEDLAEALKYVAPVSKTVGVSFEETISLLGQLSQAGIKGSMAGTSLRSIFLNLLQPNKAVAKGLKEIGAEGKGLGEILSKLTEKKLTIIDFLKTFDKTAITSTMVLADPKVQESLDNLFLSLDKQAVKAEDVAAKIRTSLTPTLQMLGNNFNELAMSVFDAFGDEPANALVGLTAKIKELDTWVDNNQDKIKKLAANIAKLADVAFTFGVDTLGLVIRNMETFSNLLIGIMGVKMLGGMAGTLKGIDKSMRLVPTWTTSWTGMVGSMNLAVIAATALNVAIDEIINKMNEATNRRNSNISDMSDAGMDKKLKDYKELYKAISDRNRAEEFYLNAQEADYKVAEQQENLRQANLAYLKQVKQFKGSYSDVMGFTDFENTSALLGEIGNLEKLADARKKIVKENTNTDAKRPGWPPFQPESTKDPKEKVDPDAYDYMGAKDDEAEDVKKEVERRLKLEEDAIKRLQTAEQADTEWQELDAQRRWEIQEESITKIKDAYWSMGESTMQAIETINSKALEKTLERLAAEEAAILGRYDTEINAASTSAFKKEQLEQEKAQKMIELQKKADKAKQDSARRQKIIDNAVAAAAAIRAVIGVVADTPGGPIARTAAGLEIGAISAGYLASLLAINMRDGGLVNGPGNGTSDSVPTYLSRGEFVVPEKTVKDLGGGSGVEAMLNRGSRKKAEPSIVIGTVIGEQSYVRDFLMPTIRKELRR